MTSKHTLGIALGFTAGYVDTVGFVALFGLFTAHVTGNFVLIGSELAHPSHGVLIKFLAFPAFILAVALARIVAVKLEASGKSAARALTGMQLLFLLAFMLLGCLSVPVQSTDAVLPLVAGIAGAAAMGIQNAASRLVWTELAPTTVMTGNVTQIVIDLVDILRGSAVTGTKARLWKFLWPVLAFGVGAVGGAFAFMYAGFFALVLPVLILCAVLLFFSE
ncbi:YoaK family protein [Undibacterium sp. Di27W]|uniref:YoaK family protein n=1 Tax=Undibacterium sp. Di27W TaxID=3413036 RepID=UPI003BF2C0EB